MRALLLLIGVAITVPVAWFQPSIGIFAYIWFSLMTPDDLAFIGGQYPLSQALAISTLIGFLIHRLNGLFALVLNPICLGLVVTCLSMLPSVFLGTDNSTTAQPYMLYVRVVIMSLLVPAIVDELPGLRNYLLVLIFSIGLIGAKVGTAGLLRGGARYANGFGYGPFVDNNFLALGFAMAVPLCWYGARLFENKWIRRGMQAMAILDACAVVWTYSRGAALSLAMVLLLLALQSKRRLLMLTLIVCVASAAIYLVRDSYLERIGTIQAPLQEESARSRIEYAQAGIKMWASYPIFGVGFGTFNFRTKVVEFLGRESDQVAHNTYVQILADSGASSFLCHATLVFGSTIWLFWSARRIRVTHPGMENYPLALGTSMVAYIVGSTFISIVKFELYHAVLMGAAVWYFCYRKLLAEEVIAESPWVNAEARISGEDGGAPILAPAPAASTGQVS